MTAFALTFTATSHGAGPTLAPKNPKDLCERYIAPEANQECAARIKNLGPDWYLASICERQFEDSDFWRCLEMSKATNFSPDKLENCAKEDLSDKERMDCLQKLAASRGKDSGFQNSDVKKSIKKQNKSTH